MVGPPLSERPHHRRVVTVLDQYQSIRNGLNGVTGAGLDGVVTELLEEESAAEAAFDGAGMASTIAAATNVEAMIFFTCSS